MDEFKRVGERERMEGKERDRKRQREREVERKWKEKWGNYRGPTRYPSCKKFSCLILKAVMKVALISS